MHLCRDYSDDEISVIKTGSVRDISGGIFETFKEALCCSKSKGASNTCQIRSVYEDEKPFSKQKYKLIHDLVKGIKALQ
ncbi:hypothetical protein RclHR1_11850003 [Rhizophagus clarus]|uniref:Uncharacterized protein n=1 Tax=Rhizophagus clarus TaxID=94130 RepID=A0A2Z6QXA0_9GLOM|nr:hypothetical protein RclHR1_11850003 [Rhizophagus clarus]